MTSSPGYRSQPAPGKGPGVNAGSTMENQGDRQRSLQIGSSGDNIDTDDTSAPADYNFSVHKGEPVNNPPLPDWMG